MNTHNRSEASGASVVKRSFSASFQSYCAHHLYSFVSTVLRLWNDKTQTLMTASVVAIALALPALLLVSLNNFQALANVWDAEPKLTFYLYDNVKPPALARLIDELKTDKRFKKVEFISKAQALTEFEQYSGFGSILEVLDNNPLPAAIELALSEDFRTNDQQQALLTEWEANALIEQGVADLQWLQRFIVITDLLRKIVLFLAGLLLLGALLVIGNTIRLIIENRKEEIIVIKLVGGTNGFVRRPLVYTGALYGLIGGGIALCLVHFSLLLLMCW